MTMTLHPDNVRTVTVHERHTGRPDQRWAVTLAAGNDRDAMPLARFEHLTDARDYAAEMRAVLCDTYHAGWDDCATARANATGVTPARIEQARRDVMRLTANLIGNDDVPCLPGHSHPRDPADNYARLITERAMLTDIIEWRDNGTPNGPQT